jgi:hypothetical protein
MQRGARIMLVHASLAVAAISLTACSSSVTVEGTNISNAKEFIAEADNVFTQNIAHASSDALTRADGSQCFFEKNDGKEISPVVYCGPVKMLGRQGSWLPVSYVKKTNSSDDLILAEPTMSDISTDPTGELFRPDGSKPVPTEDVAAPVGPQTLEKNFAVVLPMSTLRSSMNFEPTTKPAELLAPAANLTVSEKSSDPLIPGEAMRALKNGDSSGTGDGSSTDQEFYRPADGQTLSMYKVKVTGPAEMAPELDTMWGAPDGLKDASLSLSVNSGSQHLSIAGKLASNPSAWGSTSADSGIKVSCTSVPCQGPEAGEYLLVVSSEDPSVPSLVGTTDGESQSVELATGEVSSDVATVGYDRDRLRQQVSAAWGSKTATIVNDKENGEENAETTYTYGGQVSSVYLSPFEAANGWAPKGKAWLVVQVEDMIRDDEPYDSKVALDWAKSWTAKVGNETINAKSETVDDRAVFEVPESVTKASVSFLPTGVATYQYQKPDTWDMSKKQKPFTVDEALKVEVQIP